MADLLDKWDVFASRLFRESCVFHRGNYVKDLSRLGRELHKIIIVDNSPASYVFHPDNAVSFIFIKPMISRDILPSLVQFMYIVKLNYAKDLSRLGRELHKIIIVDNSPASYVIHPDNAVSFIFIKPMIPRDILPCLVQFIYIVKLNYAKDLSHLGRELHKIIIVDNSPASYVIHPDNAVSIFTHLQFHQIFWRKKIKKCRVKCNHVNDLS